VAVVLVLRALGLGDLLTAVPALRALRRARPEHRLVLAAPAALAPLARLTGAVDAILPHAGLDDGPLRLDDGPLRLDDGPLRTVRPALAVNLHGRGPRSTALLRATDPGELWSYGAGPRWTDGGHEVDRWCRLLAHHGVPADPTDLALDHPDVSSPAPGAVVIHPGAASGSRRWPVDRFAAVAAALGRDHRVVVTAGRSERDLAAAVGAEPVSTDLRQLAALVADAALVVCGDTGVAHLATAYRTPSVLLFGPTPPAEWGPRTRGPHTVLWKGGRGDPHGAQTDPALAAVTIDEVLAATRRLTRAPAAP
jgi:ADP-heptose:LPS heptosyltransferase